jgi:hypothetical protein
MLGAPFLLLAREQYGGPTITLATGNPQLVTVHSPNMTIYTRGDGGGSPTCWVEDPAGEEVSLVAPEDIFLTFGDDSDASYRGLGHTWSRDLIYDTGSPMKTVIVTCPDPGTPYEREDLPQEYAIGPGPNGAFILAYGAAAVILFLTCAFIGLVAAVVKQALATPGRQHPNP